MAKINETSLSWLAALISCDGHVRVRGKTREYRICSSDLDWLQKIQKILKRDLGIHTSLYAMGKPGLAKKPYYNLYLKNPRRVTLLLKEAEEYLMRRKAERVLSGYIASEIPHKVLVKLKTDPVFFLEKLWDLKLYPYQKEIMWEIAKGTKLILVEKGRQIGITFAIGAFALWYCVTHPQKRVLVLSLYKDQAKVPLRYCRDILLTKPFLMTDFLEFPPRYALTKTSIKFRNGSLFDVSNCRRPDATNVRSKWADILVIDEAILLFDVMFGAIEPLTVARRGQKIYISTAGAEGCFFHSKLSRLKNQKGIKEELILPSRSKLAKKIWNGGTIFYLPSCRYNPEAKTLNERFTDILCPKFTKERLQDALDDLKEINFQREYCCKWLGTENQMFPVIYKWGAESGAYETIQRFYAGLDVGEGRHPTVLVILQGDGQRCKTVKTKSWRRVTDRRTLAKSIMRVVKPYRVQEIRMDKTGAGVGLWERMIDLSAPVWGCSWTKQYKNKIMFSLKDGLGSGVLRIHEREDQLLYELRGFFAEPIEGTNYFEFKCIDSDDYVCALALAWDAVPKWELIPQIPRIIAKERRVFQ